MKCNAIVGMAGSFLLVCSALFFSGAAFAGDKPALTDEIRRVIETQGVEAAKNRFSELYPSRKDAYTVDMQTMMLLGQDYIIAGDMQTGMAVMEMTEVLAQDTANQMYSANPQTNDMMKQMAEQEKMARAQQEKEQAMVREEEQRQQQKSQLQSRGETRDDLARFSGLYTDPDDANRTLFVTVSCDGYLVTGPMWADVGPWWMRSAADKVFTYSDSFMSFSMEFETGPKGQAHTMRHELDGVGSPVEKTGPLPGDWEECVERPRR